MYVLPLQQQGINSFPNAYPVLYLWHTVGLFLFPHISFLSSACCGSGAGGVGKDARMDPLDKELPANLRDWV